MDSNGKRTMKVRSQNGEMVDVPLYYLRDYLSCCSELSLVPGLVVTVVSGLIAFYFPTKGAQVANFVKRGVLGLTTYGFGMSLVSIFASRACVQHIYDAVEKTKREQHLHLPKKEEEPEFASKNLSDYQNSSDYIPSFSSDIDLSSPIDFGSDFSGKYETEEEEKPKKRTTYSELREMNRKTFAMNSGGKKSEQQQLIGDDEPKERIMPKKTNKYGDIIE
ncbi:UNVERIFIED_CONTAM: hypothetical protein PYX00_003973 [Menopon gallinae]|uniref:Uncharacterized protein n=1 Tax=Menopon gallinae TaxID=328185 RepID=A0AAW2I4I8_9NEOP